MPLDDKVWNDFLAFLNDAAEKPPPDGIGKLIDTVDEFILFIRSELDARNLPAGVIDRFNKRELAAVRQTRADLDDPVRRKGLEDRIKELEEQDGSDPR